MYCIVEVGIIPNIFEFETFGQSRKVAVYELILGIDRVADEGESGLSGKAKGGLAKPTQVLDRT